MSFTDLYRAHIRQLAENYVRLMQNASLDAIVLHSGRAAKRTQFDDQYWPLRPVPHFQHWAPIQEADNFVVVLATGEVVLFRKRITSFWERPARLDCAHVLEVLNWKQFENVTDVRTSLPKGRVSIISEDQTVADDLHVPREWVNEASILSALDPLRARKTAYEARCIAIANERAASGHRALFDAFANTNASELDLHLLYLRATSQDDPETPYKNIVALGDNAAILHHISYEKTPRAVAAHSLLVDAGATCFGYCSDITRTWVKGSDAPSTLFRALVLRVEAMQMRLCDRVTLGEPYETLHNEAHREVATILRDLEVISVDENEAVDTGVTRTFFPHGLGHSLGLQCHDIGCAEMPTTTKNTVLRANFVIKPGQIFTIEPGVYFIDTLLAQAKADDRRAAIRWDIVEQLAPLGGVRIEDDVRVTDEAAAIENYTRVSLPKGGGHVNDS